MKNRVRGDVAVGEVLVIEDHPLFCEALAMTLESAIGVRRVVSATRLGDALTMLASDLEPDAILLDLNLPDVQGVDGLIRLRGVRPDIPVIVVSSLTDNRIITSVIQAGAAGFVPKDSPREEIVRAFRAIWEGGSYTPDGYYPPEAGQAAEASDADVIARLSELTPQQGRILELVCAGKLNKQIAWELSIAETTVKAHITAILRKLGVQSRTQAVLIAQKARFAAILQAPPN
ncbi:MAG TPA: response regulator transcription factor [Paracoccaceae bacterium]|nr:response regulator transcription factor [Paracoccaceae bacterium]